jgi:hypothetical protein
MNSLQLSILNRGVAIYCGNQNAQRLIALIYDKLKCENSHSALHYSITEKEGSPAFTLTRNRHPSMTASNEGDLVFLLETDMTIELQKLRPDLYFIHAASLDFGERAIILVGISGSGKSTTAWGLLHFGFRYLSDELAPVRLEDMKVHPYPRAICLKNNPPEPFLLPDQAMYTSRTIHIPARCLASEVRRDPVPLAAIFFLCRDSYHSTPVVKSLRNAEAAARLYASALNPLAHKGEGLEGAIEIVRKVPCFELTVGDLLETCQVVKNTFQSISDREVPIQSAP